MTNTKPSFSIYYQDADSSNKFSKNTLYTKDSYTPLPLVLELEMGSSSLKLKQGYLDGIPRLENCHFYLRFEKDVLAPEVKNSLVILNDDWKAQIWVEENHTDIYFLRQVQEGQTISINAESKLSIIIDKLDLRVKSNLESKISTVVKLSDGALTEYSNGKKSLEDESSSLEQKFTFKSAKSKTEAQPLGFHTSLIYKEQQFTSEDTEDPVTREINNTLYYQGGYKSDSLKLSVFNKQSTQVVFNSPSNDSPSQSNCHFYLRFVKGVLSDEVKRQDKINLKTNEGQDSGWCASIEHDDQYTKIYFLKLSEKTLSPKRDEGDKENKEDEENIPLDNLNLTVNPNKTEYNDLDQTVTLVYGSLMRMAGNELKFVDDYYYRVKEKFSFKVRERTYGEAHPVNFYSYYGDINESQDSAKVTESKNVLYYEESYTPEPLILKVYNQLDERTSENQTVTFKEPNKQEQEPNAKNCHFYLRFLKGVLSSSTETEKDEIIEEIKDNKGGLWKALIKTDQAGESNEDERYTNIYFLKKEGATLEPQKHFRGTEGLSLDISKLDLFININHPENNSIVTLIYGCLLEDTDATQKELKASDKDNIYYSVKQKIVFERRIGHQYIPLHVGFMGSNTVLNDGKSANNLTLRISNMLKVDPLLPDKAKIDISKDSRFLIFFEPDNSSRLSQQWKLASENEIKQIDISLSPSMDEDMTKQWKVSSPESNGEWILQPTQDLSLSPNEEILLSIEKLITSYQTGSANIYVRYENIPGYWDGQFIVPVQKTPLVYRDSNIGLGTIPQRAFDVKGDMVIQNGSLNIKGDSSKKEKNGFVEYDFQHDTIGGTPQGFEVRGKNIQDSNWHVVQDGNGKKWVKSGNYNSRRIYTFSPSRMGLFLNNVDVGGIVEFDVDYDIPEDAFKNDTVDSKSPPYFVFSFEYKYSDQTWDTDCEKIDIINTQNNQKNKTFKKTLPEGIYDFQFTVEISNRVRDLKSDNLSVKFSNLKIAIGNPEKLKLMVNGNLPLSIGDDKTGLYQSPEGELGFCTKKQKQLSIDGKGNILIKNRSPFVFQNYNHTIFYRKSEQELLENPSSPNEFHSNKYLICLYSGSDIQIKPGKDLDNNLLVQKSPNQLYNTKINVLLKETIYLKTELTPINSIGIREKIYLYFSLLFSKYEEPSRDYSSPFSWTSEKDNKDSLFIATKLELEEKLSDKNTRTNISNSQEFNSINREQKNIIEEYGIKYIDRIFEYPEYDEQKFFLISFINNDFWHIMITTRQKLLDEGRSYQENESKNEPLWHNVDKHFNGSILFIRNELCDIKGLENELCDHIEGRV